MSAKCFNVNGGILSPRVADFVLLPAQLPPRLRPPPTESRFRRQAFIIPIVFPLSSRVGAFNLDRGYSQRHDGPSPRREHNAELTCYCWPS